jgi:hypothetical protein
MRDKPLDLATLLDGWRDAAPPDGFADRVLGAIDRPATRSRPNGRPLLLAAAVAFVLLLPLAFLRSAGSHLDGNAAQSGVAGQDVDARFVGEVVDAGAAVRRGDR